jgi:S1-C subfamily serine protease
MKNTWTILSCLLLFCLSFLLSSCTARNGQNIIVESSNSAVPTPQKNKEALVAELNKSVFCISIRVKGKDFEKKVSVGTGFLVADNLLATAFHVQTRAEELSRYFRTSTYTLVAWKRLDADEIIEFPIERTLFNQDDDLAIYQFSSNSLRSNPKTESIKPLSLASNLPPISAEVMSIAYYGDYEYPFNSFGNVSMIDVNEDIVSDITLMSGNSGGPLCDLKTGEVLGVNVSVMTLSNDLIRFGFAKRATKLQGLLKR